MEANKHTNSIFYSHFQILQYIDYNCVLDIYVVFAV